MHLAQTSDENLNIWLYELQTKLDVKKNERKKEQRDNFIINIITCIFHHYYYRDCMNEHVTERAYNTRMEDGSAGKIFDLKPDAKRTTWEIEAFMGV